MATRILLIEDDEDDYIITRDLLEDIRDGHYALTWAPTFEAGQGALASGDFEVCLVDYHVGHRTGLELIEAARAHGCLVPLILLTGVAQRDVDMAAMRAGAADFLEKGQLTPVLLERAIRYAINQSRSRCALLEKSALLRTTLEYTGAGIATYDANHRLLTWNEPMLRMLGVALQTVAIGAPTADPACDQHPEEVIAEQLAVIRSAGGAHGEYIAGDGRWLEFRENPMPGGGHVVICTDITDRKRVEAHLERHQEELERQVALRTIELETVNANLEIVVSELRQAKEASEAASRAKSDFLAMMSHEIRTPMNGIIGMVQLLAKTELTAKQAHFTGSIETAAESLLAIINDILDFSKVEAGQLTISADVFQPLVVFERIVGAFADRALAKGIELLCYYDPGIRLAVRGDAGRLSQVLTNLVGNAIKFTETGEVILRATLVEAGGDPRIVRFEVEDSGIGMTPEACRRVFESFVQADGSTTRRFGGTGLGLTIARRLIELMGGTIHVESTVGKGTRFWFDIPFEDAPSTLRLGQSLDGCAGQRALVVDDNPALRALLRRQLRALDVDSDEAGDVRTAFEHLRSEARAGRCPSVVFVDRDLPELNGIALAYAMSVAPELADTTVALLGSIESMDDGAVLPASPKVVQLAKPLLLSQIVGSFAAKLGLDTRDAAGAPAAAAAAKPPSALQGRVLVAEDNLVNQEVALAMLEAWGLDGVVAETGAAAVEAVKREAFDMILMDCQMPVMDGYQATAEIRRLEIRQRSTGRPVPIVALTANAMPGDRERCLAAGMDDFVHKPFREHELRAIVATWLTQPAATGERVEPPAPPAAATGPALQAADKGSLRTTIPSSEPSLIMMSR